jgi:hypothetical protein
MRALPLLFLASLPLALACDHVSTIRILDARTTRLPDGKVATDVQLEAAEQAGESAGQYCVSVHWFNPPFDSRTLERSFYEGELDSTQACDADLSDGDQRTWRLVSNRADLAVGTPARVQVHWSNTFNVKEGVFAP